MVGDLLMSWRCSSWGSRGRLAGKLRLEVVRSISSLPRQTLTLVSVSQPSPPGPGTPVGELRPPTSGQREPRAWPTSGPTGETPRRGLDGEER